MTIAILRRSDRLLPPHRLSGAIICALALSASAVTTARAENVSHCARYGADYVAVAGSNGCVKLGGHVRVDMPRNPLAPMGYAEMHRDGMQRAASRSALPPMAPFGLHDLFPR